MTFFLCPNKPNFPAWGQVVAHANTIKAWVSQVIEYPEIKEAIEKLKGIKPQTLAQRGGFVALINRLKNKQFEQEDCHTLTAQLRNIHRDQYAAKTQERDRKGRSR